MSSYYTIAVFAAVGAANTIRLFVDVFVAGCEGVVAAVFTAPLMRLFSAALVRDTAAGQFAGDWQGCFELAAVSRLIGAPASRVVSTAAVEMVDLMWHRLG